MPSAWEILQSQNLQRSQQAAAAGTPEKFVALCVPHTGEVSMEWTLRLRDIQLPPGSQVFMSRGMPIDVTRDSMVRDAFAQGFEYVFFLDSDVILPKDAVMTLLASKLPIVSGLYKAKKPNGFFWAAWVAADSPENKDKAAFSPVMAWEGRYIKVDVVGAGCMLIHRSAYEKIRKTYPNLPLFFWSKERSRDLLDSMEIPDFRAEQVSEDFYFNLLAKAAGIDTVIDTTVQCDHISTVKITPDSVTLPGV